MNLHQNKNYCQLNGDGLSPLCFESLCIETSEPSLPADGAGEVS